MLARRNPIRSTRAGQTQQQTTADEAQRILNDIGANLDSKIKRADLHRLVKELTVKIKQVSKENKAWEDSTSRMKKRVILRDEEISTLKDEFKSKIKRLKVKKERSRTRDQSPQNNVVDQSAERKVFRIANSRA